MNFFIQHRWLSALLIFVLLVLAIAVIDMLLIRYNGKFVGIPEIPRDAQSVGSGKTLKYVILGDSTAVSQGADYRDGIATLTAKNLAKSQSRAVLYTNFAISGARIGDVRAIQVEAAAKLKPDLVLMSVGANDVTHLTSLKNVEADLIAIVSQLREANPKVKIVITGSPQMGAVPRIPQPLRWLAGWQVGEINKMFLRVATEQQLVFAYLADRTGPIFARDRSLFAADKFHPNAAGYAVWEPVLNDAIAKTF